MEKVYKDNEFMEYSKEKRVYNVSTEAIPIEWIEKYWNVDDEILTYDVITLRGNEQEVHCSIPVRTKCVQQLINDMISDWEEENETDRC